MVTNKATEETWNRASMTPPAPGLSILEAAGVLTGSGAEEAAEIRGTLNPTAGMAQVPMQSLGFCQR